MSDPASTPQDDAADEAPDLSVLRAEWRLSLLEELTLIGMELAQALRPGAAAAEDDGEPENPSKGRARDPVEAFAPLSRAIRLTLSLHAKTDQELRDLKAGVVREREEERTRRAERARVAAETEEEARKTRVYLHVMDAATAEIPEAEQFHDLMEALDERLEQDEAYIDCGRRPVRETFERLCRDLGLNPDMSRWDGDERIDPFPPARPLFSPFHTPSRRPVLREEDAAAAPAGAPQEPAPAQAAPQFAHVLE